MTRSITIIYLNRVKFVSGAGIVSLNNEWFEIFNEIRNCKKCRLHESRINPVPGEGSLTAKVVLIGEAPGRKEDEVGRPFVGLAGKFLNTLLENTGLKREEVFITNIVKCRPPGNRKPRRDEISQCLGYLSRQLRLLRPRVLILLGNTAAETIYGLAGVEWHGVMRDHGRVFEINVFGVNTLSIPTFHPAAALYNPRLKNTLLEDFANVVKPAIARLGKEPSQP
ncbi:uracil-DNA glycosylase family protein [Thermosphaera sp.]